MEDLPRILCVAPMMDRTDRHCRFLLRLLAPSALLYTEMLTAAAVLRGERARLLGFDPAEHPVALQLGGGEAREMAEAAAFGAAAGYDEININVGCPSDRVHSGAFGACLMREPARVAACVVAIRQRVTVPVTVKTRIGIEEGAGGARRAGEYDEADYARLHDFVTRVAAAGCGTFIVHARKAVLGGLSPEENRQIPPLRYEVALRLKRDFPWLSIIVNGGVRTREQARVLLEQFDGVMIGREAYRNPYFLSELEPLLRGEEGWRPPAPRTVIERLLPYAEAQLRAGQRLHALTRHLAGLFAGRPGARQWRRYFSEAAARPGAGLEVLIRACERLGEVVDAPERRSTAPAFSTADAGEYSGEYSRVG